MWGGGRLVVFLVVGHYILYYVDILCCRRSLLVTVFRYNECCTVFLDFVVKLYVVIMFAIYKCSVMGVLTFKVAAYVL